MTAVIGTLVALGMLVVVPLGLRLIDTAGGPVAVIAQAWPLAGLAGTGSLIVSRGTTIAVVLAVVYAAVTVALAAAAAERLWRRRSLAPGEIAVLTAMASPSVAGVSLVAERGGWELLGFEMTVLALTVVHFHFAGFAAALIAGLVFTAAPGPLSAAPPLAIPAGIAVVFAGYFTADAVELAGTVILSAGMWVAGWLIWQRIRPLAASQLTRILFGVSAAALAATMLLALSWAAGQVWDAIPHPSLDAMAATHGVLNAVLFASVGLVAWRRLQRERSLGLRATA
ncbi:MAG TPA: YndJ family protein [Jiangellaceae bacterium]|nr:YndJ family protein [Jiangellaceae bacterium]